MFVERAKTDGVVIGSFFHGPDDSKRETEWWDRPCIAFSTFGEWVIRTRTGGGDVSPSVVLVAAGGAEYECNHPQALDDRMVSVLFSADTDVGPSVLQPHAGELRRVGRALARELRRGELDHLEIDALSEVLLRAAQDGPYPAPRVPVAQTRRGVAALRNIAQARFADPMLDLVGEAASLGLSRTRFVHGFRDIVGASPHRYLTAVRLTHAAELLGTSNISVTEACFRSGFGTLQSFNVAFKHAYALTPTEYRSRHRFAGACAQYL